VTTINHRCRGALLGLAVGDAIGTTLEFKDRTTFEPISDMVGGGPFHLQPGQWTDDTSMALCLAESLIERGGMDLSDQMTRYCRWWKSGHLSSTGKCFDIGLTTAAALRRFQRNGEPMAGDDDPRTAGNGCLMRLAPVPIRFGNDLAAAVDACALSSRTTHNAPECVQAARLFGEMLVRALNGASKEQILCEPECTKATGKLHAVVCGQSYRKKPRNAIRGTGYVVDALEAALWAFDTTECYRDCVLAAANLGDDADTTAAIAGQLAGAHYGWLGIPADWAIHCYDSEMIISYADKLQAARGRDGEDA
jgi:ADP-ribosyl-[dinitrogen reductase] hydrolase